MNSPGNPSITTEVIDSIELSKKRCTDILLKHGQSLQPPESSLMSRPDSYRNLCPTGHPNIMPDQGDDVWHA